MQNTRGSHLFDKSKGASAVFALICVTFLAACCLIFGTPAQAHAKSYDMPKVDIQAQVETDGSLHFTEQRTFDFDGDFTAVWWTFENFPQYGELQVNGMRIASVNDDGTVTEEWRTLSEVPFVVEWRDEGGPSTEAFSVDTPQNTVYAFFAASDERIIVELDYTIINGVQAYEDVGEMYWRYVASGWQEDSENVTMTLALPVPRGVDVVPGDNVRAWGHGPLDGSLTINEDGSITYTVPKIQAGQYAEARVVFPAEWLTNLSGEEALAYSNQLRLDEVLKEEQTWADQANRDRMGALAFVIGLGVVCVLLLAWALWSYYRYGREYKPDFTDEYWRDVPDSAVHPAVIGRLWRWDRENQDDFSATLMHLAHVGAIRIDAGSYPEANGRSTKMVTDYYLTKLPAADTISDPIDRAALDLLFDTFAKGHDSLWFGTIKKYGEDHPQAFLDTMQDWQGKLSAATNTYEFFEAKGKRYQGYFIAIAVLLAVIALFIMGGMGNFIPLMFMLPTAIAIGVIANYMPRRSVAGNNLVARCKALRNWLRDFSSLDERPPTDVKVWGEFMVYAYLFGVADQAMKQLKTTMPQLFEYDGSMGSTYMPWWFWYSAGHNASGATMPSVGDMFHASMANTISTAQAATSAASGDFSSGGGFGGGFSGGGGGGFGGGGGGAR